MSWPCFATTAPGSSCALQQRGLAAAVLCSSAVWQQLCSQHRGLEAAVPAAPPGTGSKGTAKAGPGLRPGSRQLSAWLWQIHGPIGPSAPHAQASTAQPGLWPLLLMMHPCPLQGCVRPAPHGRQGYPGGGAGCPPEGAARARPAARAG